MKSVIDAIRPVSCLRLEHINFDASLQLSALSWTRLENKIVSAELGFLWVGSIPDILRSKHPCICRRQECCRIRRNRKRIFLFRSRPLRQGLRRCPSWWNTGSLDHSSRCCKRRFRTHTFRGHLQNKSVWFLGFSGSSLDRTDKTHRSTSKINRKVINY